MGFTKQEMRDMNMEELCDMVVRDNLTLEAIQAWSIFKIAQYLEKIAYEKGANK